MKIIIIGAGVIGANLAQSLSKEEHEVYLIENNEEMARRANEKLDVKVVYGNGADPDVLKKIGVENADLVIAVTTSDETNLVVCSLAACLGAKHRIARVRNTSLGNLLREVGYQQFYIDETINPEEVAAQTIVKTIKSPGAREVAEFADGKIHLRTLEVPPISPLCGTKIEDFRDEDFPWPFLIIVLIRNGDVIFPKGDTAIAAHDRIYVLLPSSSLAEFLSYVDPNLVVPKKIVIFGATNMGERVAKTLSEDIRDIILLEENPALAEEVAGRLEAVRIIEGAPSKDILKECGIEAADIFIATSNNDHANLVSAMLAKKMGAKNTIITTQQPDYMSIVDALDIDAIINPRYLAVDQILRLVRGKNVQSVITLMEGETQVLEFVPEEDSPVTKAPLKDINFPPNSIVGAISRGTEAILAKGDMQIHAGERVIVFCQESAVKKLQGLFTRKKIF